MAFLAATGRAFLNFLDIVGRLAMFTSLALSQCVRDLGATVLSIAHDLASARKIADRIAMIYKGKIIWSGAVEEIDRSANPYVEQFIHGRAEGPIRMEVDPAAGEDAADRGAAVV